MAPVWVRRSWPVMKARPKSATRTRPARSIRMLSGLTSRWAPLVGVPEGQGHVSQELDLSPRSKSLGDFVQGPTVRDELVGQVGEPFDLASRVDAEDPRVTKLRGDLALTPKASQRALTDALAVGDLDRQLPPGGVSRLEDEAHSALAQLTQDLEALREERQGLVAGEGPRRLVGQLDGGATWPLAVGQGEVTSPRSAAGRGEAVEEPSSRLVLSPTGL